ncbi:MAG: glutaredoxin family protein [Pseudomonadota bacterium]|nr:glutaredoxin family protein [Pseudomonadota bacterium]
MLPECQLFGTLGCHLCEQAEAVVMPLVEHGLLVELLDVADRVEWVEDYGLRIPVLRRVDTGAELDWPFEVEQVVRFLERLKSGKMSPGQNRKTGCKSRF